MFRHVHGLAWQPFKLTARSLKRIDTRGCLCIVGRNNQRRFFLNSLREDLRPPLSYPLEFGRKIGLYAGALLGSISMISLATMTLDDEDGESFAEFIVIVETNNNGEQTSIKRERIQSESDLFNEVRCMNVELRDGKTHSGTLPVRLQNPLAYVAHEVLDVVGGAFAWGICGYINARTVLSKACDSLIARYVEEIKHGRMHTNQRVAYLIYKSFNKSIGPKTAAKYFLR